MSSPAVSGANRESQLVLIVPSARRKLFREILEVWRYREMLVTLALREIAIRYKQTSIGVLWVLIQPIVTSAIFTFIFSYLARIPSEHVPYPVFVFSGLLLWQYFSRVLSDGSTSLVSNAGIITKIYFPRLLIPLIGVAAAAIDFLLAMLVLMGLMLLFGVAIPWTVLLIPLILLMTASLGYALALILAPINAIYRDVGFILPFAMQIAMYLSPIIYPVSFVPERLQWLYDFNPIATLLSAMRWAVIGADPPSLLGLTFYGAVTVVCLAVGLTVFRRLESTLVDRI